MTTGERIKTARKRAGMTQQELAEKLQISYMGISQWESGKRNPKKSTLERLAAVLDVPLNYLTGSHFMDEEEITDFITRVWPFADYHLTMIQQAGGEQKEIEQWERVCNELHRIHEEINADYRAKHDQLPPQAEELLEIFQRLNSKGRQKIIAIANDYTKIPEYQVLIKNE